MSARSVLQDKYDRLKEEIICHEDFDSFVGFFEGSTKLSKLDAYCRLRDEYPPLYPMKIHDSLKNIYSIANEYIKLGKFLREIERDNLSDADILIRKLEM